MRNINFYQTLQTILEAENPSLKFELFDAFYKAYTLNQMIFEEEFTTKNFQEPSYQGFCPVVAPQVVPKRKNLTTVDGQINLIHAIAHIEYSAIDLALDAAYRFHNMTRKFYDDWLEVAADEIRHFKLLEELLNELGAKYGDVAVHNALFEASQRTQTLLERMAVVPRYLEANGLDATPLILQKIQKLPKDAMLTKLSDRLQIILDEEVEHVRKGDEWFKYACEQEKVNESVYFEIIQKYYPQGFLKAKNLNIEARKEAGFSCKELKFIAKDNLC